MPFLVDCRGVERMLVTPSGVQAAVMVEVTMVDRRQPPWSVAVIAPQDEVFWMARTYEVLRAGSPERVRVFRRPSGGGAVAPLGQGTRGAGSWRSPGFA